MIAGEAPMDEQQRLDAITETIIGAAINVHRVLGPGLLESAYERCLDYELKERGLGVERQLPLSLTYSSMTLECANKLDLVVERSVVVEIKAIEQLARIHSVQLLSYPVVRSSGRPPDQLPFLCSA
jgi:GxxExxY protein